MALHVRTVAKKGKVEVTFEIQRLQMATYRVATRNLDGTARRELGWGDNVGDTEPDSFAVAASGTALKKKYLVYWITFAALDDSAGQRFRAEIQLYQAGKKIDEPIVEEGPIDQSANAIGAVQFVVE